MNKYLIKLADHLDKKGLYKEASYVDWMVNKFYFKKNADAVDLEKPLPLDKESENANRKEKQIHFGMTKLLAHDGYKTGFFGFKRKKHIEEWQNEEWNWEIDGFSNPDNPLQLWNIGIESKEAQGKIQKYMSCESDDVITVNLWAGKPVLRQYHYFSQTNYTVDELRKRYSIICD